MPTDQDLAADTIARLEALCATPPNQERASPGRLFRAMQLFRRHRQKAVSFELSLSHQVGAILGRHSGWDDKRAVLNRLLFSLPGATVCHLRPLESWLSGTRHLSYASRKRHGLLLMRRLMGMSLCPVGSAAPLRGVCGHPLGAGYHCVSCPTRYMASHHHNAVVRAIVDLIREFRLADEGSMRWMTAATWHGRTPDITFSRTADGVTTLVAVDVSMVGVLGKHILGDPHSGQPQGMTRAQAMNDGSALLRRRERSKRDHYANMVACLRRQPDTRVLFIPFVCQSMGGLGEVAWRFINHLAGWAVAATGRPYLAVRRLMMAHVGVVAAASWASITAQGVQLAHLDMAVRVPGLSMPQGPPRASQLPARSAPSLERDLHRAVRSRELVDHALRACSSELSTCPVPARLSSLEAPLDPPAFDSQSTTPSGVSLCNVVRPLITNIPRDGSRSLSCATLRVSAAVDLITSQAGDAEAPSVPPDDADDADDADDDDDDDDHDDNADDDVHDDDVVAAAAAADDDDAAADDAMTTQGGGPHASAGGFHF